MMCTAIDLQVNNDLHIVVFMRKIELNSYISTPRGRAFVFDSV